jgi:Protein of unknown function (DUF2961)
MDIACLRDAQSRSVSAENPTGEPGRGGMAAAGTGQTAARDLGVGWKVAPSIVIEPGATATLADVAGPGVLRHIWLTVHPAWWRQMVLRAQWDDDPQPAVVVPLGDFFGQAWAAYAPLSSQFVTVAPHGGLNSYWPMPFRRRAALSLQNLSAEPAVVYYQVDYTVEDVPANAAYLHAEWRRSWPVGDREVHTILSDVHGRGHYAGTYLAAGVTHPGWWGEGEVKFYLDGDQEFPTICGTGTEDYFGGAYNWDVPGAGYTTYSSPYLGLHQIIRPDGLYRAQQRFGMYRWHGPDPVHFKSSLRVTVQDLGWRRDGRYLARRDDLASTAFWYLEDPGGRPRDDLSIDQLEVGGESLRVAQPKRQPADDQRPGRPQGGDAEALPGGEGEAAEAGGGLDEEAGAHRADLLQVTRPVRVEGAGDDGEQVEQAEYQPDRHRRVADGGGDPEREQRDQRQVEDGAGRGPQVRAALPVTSRAVAMAPSTSVGEQQLTPTATTSGTPAPTANASASDCPAQVRSPAML